MTLPASGAISLSQVNTELGFSSTATITMNDSAVRTLFGQASGTVDMNTGHGKSYRVNLSVTYSTNGTTATTLSLSGIGGYVAGKSTITINQNAGVYMYSTSTASPALNITGGSSGDIVSLNLSPGNGGIMGQGGAGGALRAPIAAGAGGTALQIAYPITVTVPGFCTLGGGGGGGGGGGTWRIGPAITIISGGGGGGGQGGGAGGPSTASSPGVPNYNAGTSGGAGGGTAPANASGVIGAFIGPVGGGGGGTSAGGAGGGGGAAGASGAGGGRNFQGNPSPGGTNTYFTSVGGAGGSFSIAATAGITQAAGGGGGGWGAAGGAGRIAAAPGISISAAQSGGAAGKAINTQGNSVTLAGDGRGTRVKGIVG